MGHEKGILLPQPLRSTYKNIEYESDVSPNEGVYVMRGSSGYSGGLMTENGRWILPPSHDFKFLFYAGEGRWRIVFESKNCKFVKNGDCYKYVNSKGELDPEVEFAWAYNSENNFSEGLALVKQADGAEGYMNKDGVWGISPETLKSNLARWYKAEDDVIAMKKREADKIQQDIRRKEEHQLSLFRKYVKEGSDTNCGAVIKAKPAMVNVNFPVKDYGNERWIKRSQIFPQDYECRFINGIYQIPAMKSN